MDNENLENKLAMHLSGVLNGMCYEQGARILGAFCGNRATINIFYSLAERRGKDFILCETWLWISDQIKSVMTQETENIFAQYGISSFYYQMLIKPTAEELIQFLDDYDVDYEKLNKEEMLDKAIEEVDKLMGELDFKEIKDYFEDIKDIWLVEDDEEVDYEGGRRMSDD